MIVVTVGTTMPFPSLLAEVDRLSALGIFRERVICQTGYTDYRVRFCESFKFRPTLDDLFAEASLVVTHGGSTVFSLLSNQKPFIAFPNPIGADDHQRHVLRTLAEQADILWSENVADLEQLYHRSRTRKPAVFKAPKLGDKLLQLINGSG